MWVRCKRCIALCMLHMESGQDLDLVCSNVCLHNMCITYYVPSTYTCRMSEEALQN